MEKKLSELLKLVISDCHLVRYIKLCFWLKLTHRFLFLFWRKFYHEDSIILSSQAYILSDQLAGLNALDFRYFNWFIYSFYCLKIEFLEKLLLQTWWSNYSTDITQWFWDRCDRFNTFSWLQIKTVDEKY